MRVSITQLEDSLLSLQGDLEMVKHIVLPIRQSLNRTKINAQNRLRNAKRSTVTNSSHIQTLVNLLTQTKHDIKEIDNDIRQKQEDIDSLEKEITNELRDLEKAESTIKNMQWENRKKEVSIHTKIENILTSHGVTIQMYHGGLLTGGAVLVLLEKHQSIMDDITMVCHQYINDRRRDNTLLDIPTIDEFDINTDFTLQPTNEKKIEKNFRAVGRKHKCQPIREPHSCSNSKSVNLFEIEHVLVEKIEFECMTMTHFNCK